MLDDALDFQKKVSRNYSVEIQKKFYFIYAIGSKTLQTASVEKNENRFDFVNHVVRGRWGVPSR